MHHHTNISYLQKVPTIACRNAGSFSFASKSSNSDKAVSGSVTPSGRLTLGSCGSRWCYIPWIMLPRMRCDSCTSSNKVNTFISAVLNLDPISSIHSKSAVTSNNKHVYHPVCMLIKSGNHIKYSFIKALEKVQMKATKLISNLRNKPFSPVFNVDRKTALQTYSFYPLAHRK